MAALTAIQTSFSAGEISPELFGRVDLGKWRQGASTMRNMFVSYRGGAMSRPGLAYVGTCKQPGTSAPPRDIPFQFSITQGIALEFGDNYLRFKSNGGYILESTKAISGATKANPCVLTITAHGYSVGDWIFISGMLGMTNFNGLTWIISAVTTNTVTVTDLFGNPVNSTGFNTYVSGGTSARLYTLTTPYAAVDLPYLKYTQSADTMTLTCVNPMSLVEYPPYDLVRNGNANWALSVENFGSSISAPTGVAISKNSSTTLSTFYSYCVTAVSSANGDESVASAVVTIENNDISINAGSNVITWAQVSGAQSYNIYAAEASYTTPVPVGTIFGFVGSSIGNQFVDTNIQPDFTTVPPTHQNPFARGQILQVKVTAGGSSYTQATVGFTVSSTTGSGFAGTPVVLSGAVVGFFVTNPGMNYTTADTVTITDSGTGTGATAVFFVGPQTGTYPGVCAYFQQRRVYGSTLNNPDTYYMSQPGSFLNMDSSIPIIASDAIIGTPWSQQVNGIQFLVQMPSGLIVLTGKGAWQLTGGNSAAFTAIDQDATPQAYNGCNAQVPPIVVNYDILYVQSKGSIVRDLSYNFFVNIYTGTDMTVLSSHLFQDFQIQQWAYAEEPFKIVWCVRNDGTLLSLTYLKEQDVYGWARHDTNGLVQGVCSIVEPPVDALYVITQRFVRGVWKYYAERMDDRNWQTSEQNFCVDAGLSYPQTFPHATLTPAAANGTSNISSVGLISGGSGYTAPTVTAVDPTGNGSGATFAAVVVGGVITAITPVTEGQNYSVGGWFLTVTDATGTGCIAQPVITNNVTFTASSAVFTNAMIGDVLRIIPAVPTSVGNPIGQALTGSGKAIITGVPGVAAGPITTPTQIGNANQVLTGGSLVTSANSAANNCIVVICGSSLANSQITSVGPDSAGNIYTQAAQSAQGSIRTCAAIFYCANAAALPSGGTIPITINENASFSATAISIPGVVNVNPVDKTNSAVGIATAPASIATGTLSQSNEIVISGTMLGGTSGGFTEDSGFTENTDPASGANQRLLSGYAIVVSTTSVGYAPTWVTSREYASVLVSFEGGVTTGTQAIANIIQPITATVPDDPNNTPIPATSGNWSISVPTMTVTGLNHLEGLTVSILADGNVIAPQVVTNGAVTLPEPYSQINIGLPFTWQLQSLYLEPPGQPMTLQTKRKNVFSVGVRLANSRGVTVGSNQPDASTQPNGGIPPWANMKALKERQPQLPAGVTIPMKTGDEFINIPASWDTRGQVAFQGTQPLGAEILALVAYWAPGDTFGSQ